MNKLYFTLVLLIFCTSLKSQITPTNSPYYSNGNYTVVSDSNLTDLNNPVLFYYPQTVGTYPVVMFQLGANGFGSSVINRHTYDLFVKHLASYGFVVMVIDDAQAGFPNGGSFTNTHDWFKDKVVDPTHWLSNYADTNKVIIGGHSNGGVNASALLVDRPTEIDGIFFMDSYPSSGVIGIGGHDVSNYTGKVLTMSADENDPAANKEGWDKFTSSQCKTYVSIAGLDHGGFGDYVLASQPVGPIGRTDATASIRHFLVSWMLSEYSGDNQATTQLTTNALHPNTVEVFINDCGTLSSSLANEPTIQEVSIFPNPTEGKITIVTKQDDFNISIFNSLGQEVYSQKSKTNKVHLDINHLPQGVYVVNLTSQDGYYSKKIIKN